MQPYGIANTKSGFQPLFSTTGKFFFMPRSNANGIPNRLRINPPGTVAVSEGTVTGTLTKFTSDFTPGAAFVSGNNRGYVIAIASDTSMTISNSTAAVAAGALYNNWTLNYFKALINNPNPSMRLYPSPNVENAENMRGDAQFETMDSGVQFLLEEGTRKVKALLTNQGNAATPQMLKQLQSISTYGQELVVFMLDVPNKNLWGMDNTADYIDGMRIDTGSFHANWNPGNKGKTQNILLEFNIHPDENDADLIPIANKELDATLQKAIPYLEGLHDVAGSSDDFPLFLACAHGGTAKVDLNTFFGSKKNPTPVTGLTKANLTIVDNTTDGANPVTINSVTEETNAQGLPTGIYDIAFTGAEDMDAADVLQFTWSADGYDFSIPNGVTQIAT